MEPFVIISSLLVSRREEIITNGSISKKSSSDGFPCKKPIFNKLVSAQKVWLMTRPSIAVMALKWLKKLLDALEKTPCIYTRIHPHFESELAQGQTAILRTSTNVPRARTSFDHCPTYRLRWYTVRPGSLEILEIIPARDVARLSSYWFLGGN